MPNPKTGYDANELPEDLWSAIGKEVSARTGGEWGKVQYLGTDWDGAFMECGFGGRVAFVKHWRRRQGVRGELWVVRPASQTVAVLLRRYAKLVPGSCSAHGFGRVKLELKVESQGRGQADQHYLFSRLALPKRIRPDDVAGIVSWFGDVFVATEFTLSKLGEWYEANPDSYVDMLDISDEEKAQMKAFNVQCRAEEAERKAREKDGAANG